MVAAHLQLTTALICHTKPCKSSFWTQSQKRTQIWRSWVRALHMADVLKSGSKTNAAQSHKNNLWRTITDLHRHWVPHTCVDVQLELIELNCCFKQHRVNLGHENQSSTLQKLKLCPHLLSQQKFWQKQYSRSLNNVASKLMSQWRAVRMNN